MWGLEKKRVLNGLPSSELELSFEILIIEAQTFSRGRCFGVMAAYVSPKGMPSLLAPDRGFEEAQDEAGPATSPGPVTSPGPAKQKPHATR